MYTGEMTTMWNGTHKGLIQPHLHHHKVLKFEKHRKDDAIIKLQKTYFTM